VGERGGVCEPRTHSSAIGQVQTVLTDPVVDDSHVISHHYNAVAAQHRVRTLTVRCDDVMDGNKHRSSGDHLCPQCEVLEHSQAFGEPSSRHHRVAAYERGGADKHILPGVRVRAHHGHRGPGGAHGRVIDCFADVLPVAVDPNDRVTVFGYCTVECIDTCTDRTVEEIVVGIEEAQVLPRCVGKANVSCLSETTVAATFDHPNAGVGRSKG